MCALGSLKRMLFSISDRKKFDWLIAIRSPPTIEIEGLASAQASALPCLQLHRLPELASPPTLAVIRCSTLRAPIARIELLSVALMGILTHGTFCLLKGKV